MPTTSSPAYATGQRVTLGGDPAQIGHVVPTNRGFDLVEVVFDVCDVCDDACDGSAAWVQSNDEGLQPATDR